jgi:hypothetical protein
MRRGTALAAATAAALTSATAAGPASAAGARVEYSDVFTTQEPGVPSGRVFYDEYFDAEDPSAKPPSLSHIQVRLPEGARFNTDAVAQCTASDAELTAQGPAACPEESVVGTEVYVFDTGFPEPERMRTTDITFLNERDGAIVVTRDRGSGARVVLHAEIGPETYDLDVPLQPGTPPYGGSNKREDAVFRTATGPGGAWLTTPPTCPADGAWTFRATYTFRDAPQVVKESRSPCRAGAVATATRLTFFRRQRARAGRRGVLRLRASRAATATIQAGRARRSARLRAGLNRVRLPALARGRYVLTVRAAGATRRARLTVR